MGPYCNYCGQRCFLLRVIPDGPLLGEYLLLATCARGMEHDQIKTAGHTHATAVNPYTDRESAARIAARRAAEDEPHRHDGGCTWAGCGPWGEDDAGMDLAAVPDTLTDLREPS